MEIETVTGPWTKLKATNFTNASFGTLKSTLTEPSGDGVIDLAVPETKGRGGSVDNALILKFFGTSASDQTANCRVWGWALEATTLSWENVLLAQFALTLGNLAGTASCAITASDFEVDTIALTYGNDDVVVSIVSPGNDVRGAYVMLDAIGFPKLQVEFDRNSSAASLNALYRTI